MSINEKPVEHVSFNMVTFKAKRADLVGGVDVYVMRPMDSIELMQACADFTSWHCLCIWEQLNGFAGYDNIKFRLHDEEPS